MKTRKSRKITGGAGEDFTEIYDNFFEKQMGKKGLVYKELMLIKKLKEEIMKKYSNLSETDAIEEANKLAITMYIFFKFC